MRKDYVIAILLAIAAIPAGAALMAAPLKFEHLQPWVIDSCFYGGIGLTLVLIASAVFVAVHGEKTEADKPTIRRLVLIIGIIIFSTGALAYAAYFFGLIRFGANALSSIHEAPFAHEVHSATNANGSVSDSEYVLQSTPNKIIVMCKMTYDAVILYGSKKTDVMQTVKIFGNTVWFSVKVSAIERGIDFDLTPKTDVARKKVSGANKLRVTIQDMTGDTMMVYYLDFNAPIADKLSATQYDPSTEPAKNLIKNIESGIGQLAKDKCRIL
jgi:hypothetical protein